MKKIEGPKKIKIDPTTKLKLIKLTEVLAERGRHFRAAKTEFAEAEKGIADVLLVVVSANGEKLGDHGWELNEDCSEIVQQVPPEPPPEEKPVGEPPKPEPQKK